MQRNINIGPSPSKGLVKSCKGLLTRYHANQHDTNQMQSGITKLIGMRGGARQTHISMV